MPRAPSKPDLHLVPPVTVVDPEAGCDSALWPGVQAGPGAVHDLMDASENRPRRIQRLQAEARDLAMEDVAALDRLLVRAARAASEVAAGGEAYPVGARELASRLVTDLNFKAETLRMILRRQV